MREDLCCNNTSILLLESNDGSVNWRAREKEREGGRETEREGEGGKRRNKREVGEREIKYLK